MDLLIVGDMVPSEHTLNLLKVPVWDDRDALNIVRCPSNMAIQTIRSIDAEAEAEIVALPSL